MSIVDRCVYMLGAICGSAQSMDCAAQWIHTLRRNPWIAQESVDRAGRSMNFAYDTIQLAQTYMDGLVISTNLKLNNFTHFNGLNGPLQSTEQNHRPSASELGFTTGAQGRYTCRNITVIT